MIHAIAHVVFIINILPTMFLNFKSPYHILYMILHLTVIFWEYLIACFSLLEHHVELPKILLIGRIINILYLEINMYKIMIILLKFKVFSILSMILYYMIIYFRCKKKNYTLMYILLENQNIFLGYSKSIEEICHKFWTIISFTKNIFGIKQLYLTIIESNGYKYIS